MDTEQSYSDSNLFDHYYDHVSDRSELSKRTARTNILQSQAAFFSLITRLNVPVLNRSASQLSGQDHLFVGAGASFGVTRTLFTLSDSDNQTINKIRGDSGKLPKALASRLYVTKRIAPSNLAIINEAQTLAAITNEVRILANRTLKETKHLVRLLGIAWDEVPTYGRHWPRVLLEAADYGNLGEFMVNCPEASDWKVKTELLLGIVAGLQSLHQHGVAHCDVKLENVLVFRAEKADEEYEYCKYQAKICDFGFSVILTDYDKDSTFAERIGTEPWTSPELTFGTQISIADLPKTDIYSFGLLLARVFMNGGSPFQKLSVEETRELKREHPNDSLVLHRHLTEAIFAGAAYPELQSLHIQRLLLLILIHTPEARLPLHLIGANLLLGLLIGGVQSTEDDTKPQDEETHSQAPCIPQDEAGTHTTKPEPRFSFHNVFQYVFRRVKMGLRACLLPARVIGRLGLWALRRVLGWTVSLDPMFLPDISNHLTGNTCCSRGA
jgi:serine/threonine protein kinase